MRNREQRMVWIENLIGTTHAAPSNKNVLSIQTPRKSIGIAFAAIEEVRSAKRVQPFAFLPKEFCGVLHRGFELAPVIALDESDDDASHVVLVRSRDCLLGFRFASTPSVVELTPRSDALPAVGLPTPLVGMQRTTTEGHPITLLDITATVDALIDLS